MLTHARALCGRPDTPCLLNQGHVCCGFNTGPGVRCSGDYSTEAGITPRYISEAWLLARSQIGSICANHVMEIPSPAPENVCRSSPGTNRRRVSWAAVSINPRQSPVLKNETRTLSAWKLKLKILAKARWAPDWGRSAATKSFPLYENKNKLAEAVLMFSELWFPV